MTTTIEATQVEQRPSNDINQDCVGDPTSTSDITKIIYISEEQHSSSELASEVELGSKTNVRNSTITNIGDGVGFGGRFWDWEREASHCCGKSVAAQACSIAGEAAVTAGLAGGLDGEWGGLWCAAEERVRMRERERER